MTVTPQLIFLLRVVDETKNASLPTAFAVSSKRLHFISGRESGSLWKWYQTMDDLSSAELNLRESFDGATSRLNSTYQNSPLSASQEDEPSYSRDERFELNYGIYPSKFREELHVASVNCALLTMH